jgi:putative transposase
MIKTYKYRLYPTKKQIEKLEWTLETCRILYNSCLVDRNRHYEETGKSLSRIDQQKILVQDKKNINYLTNIHSQVLQDVLFRIEKAYKSFFRRLKEKKKKGEKAGYPRFKNYGRYDSITYTQSGFEIKDGKLKLSKIGHIKIKLHRNIDGRLKTCNIKKEIDRWYVCFSIYLLKSEKRLIKKQRQLSRKKKGSNNRKKTQFALSKLHKHIANQRKDFHHKVSRYIVDNYGYIAVEDLSIKNMIKNHNLAKSISDAGWGQFISFLNYKAEEAGCYVEKVNPRNTSKKCSVCGYIFSDMTLSIREWICPICNTEHNRDINASINILNKQYGGNPSEFTLGEISSVDDRSISYLKSTLSLSQEAYQTKRSAKYSEAHLLIGSSQTVK